MILNKFYKAVLFGNGTMGERHRVFFEKSGVCFLKIFDLSDLQDDGSLHKSLVNEFLSSEKIDFAVIASPATTHYQYAKLCLERKISVFVEKPLAVTGECAQELVDLAIRNDVVLFVAQSECFNPVFLNFRKHFMAELQAMKARDEFAKVAENANVVGNVAEVMNCAAAAATEINAPSANAVGNVANCAVKANAVGNVADAQNYTAAEFAKEVAKVPVQLEFRREHRYSERCRDVNAALDLMVHDLSLCLSMFRYEDLKVSKFLLNKNGDRAQMQINVVKGDFVGTVLNFVVDRNSENDVRTVSVKFARTANRPAYDYSVSLAQHDENGDVVHVPDSLENEHKFFLKLMLHACAEWGRRAAQSSADAVKLATSSIASS